MLDSLSEDLAQDMRQCMLELQATNGTNGTQPNASVCDPSLLDKMEKYVTPLWEADFLMAVVYCTLVGVALLIGTFGNIIILILNLSMKTLNRVGKAFIINLAFADLCVAAVADPMCIVGVVKGEQWLQSRWLLCEVIASMCLTACFCAFLSLTVMTINRYVYVCHNEIYHKLFNRYVCVFLCLSCWICGFIFEFPNFIGWGDHYFDKKSHQCIWDRTSSLSYTLLVAIGLIGGPLLLMGLLFILIFIKIWRTKLDVYSLNLDDPLRMRRVWVESLKASRTLAVVFMAFVICWTPYAVVIAMDVNDDFSMEVHLYVTLLAHLHSSLNFTIYMIFNKKFRQAVAMLFHCKFGKSWKYVSSTDTGKTTETSRGDSSAINVKKLYYINTQESFPNNVIGGQSKPQKILGTLGNDTDMPRSPDKY